MRFFSSLAFASRRRITNSYDVTNSQPPLPGLHSLVYLPRVSLACTRNSERSFEWSATEEVKRIYKSGAQKRKEAKALKIAKSEIVNFYCDTILGYMFFVQILVWILSILRTIYCRFFCRLFMRN